MNRRAALILSLIFGGFFVLFLIFLGVASAALHGQTTRAHLGGSGPRIGVVEIKGIIGEERNGVEGTKEAEQIHDFAQDDDIKAIVVRIDSPGGAVAPSQEIWAEIKRAREKKKIVCSQGNLAASGGYYVSVACDKIVADPGTLTGSIGVISQFFSAKDLIALTKIQETTLKTGALKDSGSPFRDFTEDDRKYFDGLLHEIFEQFLAAVAEGRHKKIEEIRPLADGRVFSGTKAKELGLVDEIGNFRDAVNLAMSLAGVSGEAQLVYPEKKSAFWMELLKDGAHTAGHDLAQGAAEELSGAGALKSGILVLAPGFN